ncbi:hypothetical protein L1987_26331 [Smallanthus sonchifolius]|uniref:Uncharacterized protein n=1 Tax=Smallanthus sonchifolius TaxID=185202 RepID=A0ACB9IAP4_9ASTR|nr:hypothetical protein L1987_26331 [Smallanthus sonchifolius]
MAPIDTTTPLHATVDMEIPVKWSAQKPEYKASKGVDGVKNHGVVDAALRAVVFVCGLAAVIVMVTSKQSKMIPISPVMSIPLDANWNQSPAYIYYVVAFSVACLYNIITCVLSVLTLKKTGDSTKLQFHLAILDSLLLGIVSSALGAELALAYIGLKGNPHSFWKEICNAYGSFCHHLSASTTMAIVSIIALLLLVWHSYYTLSKKIVRG